MKINKNIYHLMVNRYFDSYIETGGILGGSNGIVTNFIFDIGLSGSDRRHYYPNTDKLNACLLEWQESGIEFYGIIHSHLTNETSLSKGDKSYIKKIMLSMPADIKELFFPIVIPRKEIILYKARRLRNEINITDCNINIL